MIVRVTLLLAIAWIAVVCMRRGTAATRHAVLVAALVAALALPLLPEIVPAVIVDDAFVVDLDVIGGAAGFNPPAAPGGLKPAAPQVFPLLWLTGFVLVAAAKLVAVSRAIGIVRRARNGISHEIDQPMTFGRRVLLPASAATWSGDRLRAVLLHELAHVARHDSLVALVSDLACAVYWFHPLVWVMAHRARLERERACDDAVLTAGIPAEDYASAIVEVARATRMFTPAMPMAAKSQLEARIEAILDPRCSRRRSHWRAAAIAVLFLAPALAALDAIPRPRGMEPDLLGDSIARPQSELLTVIPSLPAVEAKGPDAQFIAFLIECARREPRHDIDYVPQRARWALTRVRDGHVIEPLLADVHDRDWRVRAYAAWTLGYANDERATRPLVEMLHSDVWRERAMAAHALANLADPAAEEAMLDIVDDPAWQVRGAIARYLAVRRVHPRVLAALQRDRHMYVRGMAGR